MARLFGTDGVRGLANGDLTAELALDLSVAAAHVLADRRRVRGAPPARRRRPRHPRSPGSSSRPRSSPAWRRPGVDVLRLGVLPTPGVAYLTERARRRPRRRASRASHNPMPDNGIKFFARGGLKLDDAIEDAIEQRARRAVGAPDRRRRRPGHRRTPTRRRRVRRPPGRAPSTARSPGSRSCSTAPTARRHDVGPARPARRRRRGDRDPRRARRPQHQRRLRLHPPRRRCARPCSSTAPTSGFALDGDADRCLAVDHDGQRSSTATRSWPSSRSAMARAPARSPTTPWSRP